MGESTRTQSLPKLLRPRETWEGSHGPLNHTYTLNKPVGCPKNGVHRHLPVGDLPGAWNAKYAQYLGIEPPDNRLGVLQDIHWSGGAIGYFPTYSLGNLYAAQFFAQADSDLAGLAGLFARGEFAPLRDWLSEKIHRQGQRYTAAELVQRVTGRPLGHESLVEHLRAKLGPLYGLA